MSLENSPLPIYLVGDGHLSSFLKPLLNQEFQTFGRQGKDYFFDLDQLDQFTPPEKKGLIIYMIPPRKNAVTGLKRIKPILNPLFLSAQHRYLEKMGGLMNCQKSVLKQKMV